MATVFLSGAFLDTERDRVLVSAFDAGLQHGVGLFETLLGGVGPAGDPWALHLDEHLDRLAGSAKALGLSDSLRTGALGEAVLETLRRSGLERARVRLTVTGGDLNMLAAAKASAAGAPPGAGRAQEPTILIVAQPATQYPPAMIQRGVGVSVADGRVNPLDPFASHKTLNYWWRLRELQLAGAKNAAEALVFTVSNHLAGGCVSSALLVKDGLVLAPIARGEEEDVAHAHAPASERPGEGGERASGGGLRSAAVLPSPVLPGVTRAEMLHAAQGAGMQVRRRMLTISDVLGADEVLLTNSSWGVLPVVRVEGATIGLGEPGPVGRQLAAAWSRQIGEAAELT